MGYFYSLVNLYINVPYTGVKFFDTCLDIVNLLPDKTRNAIGILCTKSFERFEIIMHLLILRAQTLLSIRFAQKRRPVKLNLALNTKKGKPPCHRFKIYPLLYGGGIRFVSYKMRD